MNFSVITVRITPLEILVRGLLQMHLDVLESVLLDVSDTQVGMLIHTASGWDCLASKHLDQGGLSGTVSSNDGSSGR